MFNKLLVIVGPTAVGKSAFGLHLAQRFDGEIVSADSRQVYRHMDIGTAKPMLEERAAVPHHLVDIINPDQQYSLSLFLRQANQVIEEVQARGKLPILVGGTGQYVWALLEGWQVPEVPPAPEIRRRLEERAAVEGAGALYYELRARDPEAASRIDRRNVRRVVRALEILISQGASASGRARIVPPYNAKIIGLTMERAALYQRIDERIDRMIEAGWVDEVRRLLAMGYEPSLPSMSSLGYGELARHIRGEASLEDAVSRIKYSTHRFARHQYAWFRLSDARIQWHDASEGWEAIEAEARQWMETL